VWEYCAKSDCARVSGWRGERSWFEIPLIQYPARQCRSTAPFRAGRFMNRHLGLKPQAESYSPFGTKSDTSRRDGTIGSDWSAMVGTINQLGVGSYRALLDGSRFGRIPGNKLPGYHLLVPPGQVAQNPFLLRRPALRRTGRDDEPGWRSYFWRRIRGNGGSRTSTTSTRMKRALRPL
jgi:hypothetical protein